MVQNEMCFPFYTYLHAVIRPFPTRHPHISWVAWSRPKTSGMEPAPRQEPRWPHLAEEVQGSRQEALSPHSAGKGLVASQIRPGGHPGGSLGTHTPGWALQASGPGN